MKPFQTLSGIAMLAAALAAAPAARGDDISWDFGTSSPGTASPSSPAVANLNQPALTQYNNYGTTAILSSSSASSGYTGASGVYNAAAAARTGALNTSAGGSAALEFTLTPDTGYQVTLSAISFGARSTSTGPQSYALRSSADGYAADLATGSITNTSVWALKSNNGLSAVSTASVTYRLFGYAGTGSPAAGTANWRIDDLKLAVSVTAVAPDTSPPSLESTTPADGATGVATSATLSLTFTEAVVAGAGSVKLLADGNSTPVQTFPASSGVLGNSDRTVTFTPSPALAAGTSYHVEIDATAFTDTASPGNAFAGISNATAWNFATVAPDTTAPTATLAPADDATGVAADAGLVLTFSEAVGAGTGSVRFYAASAPSTPVETFAAASGAVSGNTVTFTPAAPLSNGTAYFVQVDATAFHDGSGNYYAGIASQTAWSFTTIAADVTGPAPGVFEPANHATDIVLDALLYLTFDEDVIQGATGGIHIFESGAGGDTLVETISANGGSGVSGGTASFSPAAFTPGTTYYVLLDAGAFTDLYGNPCAAITDPNTWRFTTVPPDVTAPVPGSFTPANNSTGVPLGSSLTVTCDEPVTAGTGSILIRRLSDESTVATIDVGDSAQFVTTLNSPTATLHPSVPLPPNTTLYVEIPAGAIKDLAGNPCAAAGGAESWAFSTVVIPELTAFTPYTQTFAGYSSAAPTLPDGWTLAGPVTAFEVTAGNQLWGEGALAGPRGGASVLGYQHSGSTATLVKSLALINATGAPITDLTVSYRGRAARLGNPRIPAYAVAINGAGVAALAYAAESDGAVRQAAVSNLYIPPGEIFTLAWTSDNLGGGTGSSRQIGISEVFVAAGLVPLPPEVATVSVTADATTHTSMAVASSVTSDGGSAITGRGFVYAASATNAVPAIGGAGVTQIADANAATGAMAATLSGLSPATSYAVRAYAINGQGTVYSPVTTASTYVMPASLVASYTQDFAAFSSSTNLADARTLLPAGWETACMDFSYDGKFGLNTAGGFRGGDQVLGYQHTGTTNVLTVSLHLSNDSGSTVNTLWVSYKGRVAVTANTRFPTWEVTVNGVPRPALAYSSTAGVDQTLAIQLTGLSIAPGQLVTVSWKTDGNVGASGSRRQIGISAVYVGLGDPAAGYNGWKSVVGNQTPGEDYDGDGLDNGVEYFMGTAGNAFTAAPVPSATAPRTITWPRNPSATVSSFKVEQSSDLINWTDVTSAANTSVGTQVQYTLPAGTGKVFVRLGVTP